MIRTNLLWVSSGNAGPVSNIFGEDRNYDVFYHNYGSEPVSRQVDLESRFLLEEPGEKLNVAGKKLPAIFGDFSETRYNAFAFLDDDLNFDTATLNRCFNVGESLSLDIWQPALTWGSHCSHKFLKQQLNSVVRPVPFVEVMMPFFSKRVIAQAVSTFDINESGWGLDCFMWPKIAQGYVIDALVVGHYRQPERRERLLSNGLTPFQELWIQHKIHQPETAPFYPPGYKPETIQDALTGIDTTA